MEELQPARPNRRLQIILIIAALLAFGLIFSVCAMFTTIAPKLVLNVDSPTPNIEITGTIEQIAGMPVPYGANITAQMTREKGGTFDYTTPLRPQQIYNFYYGVLTQRGIWRAGTQPQIADNSGEFQFYAGIPRLTIITVKCDGQLCNVHVDY